jgi:hypothetical protein
MDGFERSAQLFLFGAMTTLRAEILKRFITWECLRCQVKTTPGDEKLVAGAFFDLVITI